jgi:glyoxylase-like metal-dependent hydrolase (beta-lactamase superfamily II)
MPVENGLTALGVTPTDISTIIISHMHYDHVGNLDLFPNANLIVQQWEWDFWTGPMAARAQFAQLTVPAYVENMLAAHSEKRIHTISGDVEVATGISTLLLTGHTPGQQGLLIETPENTICLASDAAHFYDELRNDWPFCIVSDLLGMYKSLDRLRELEDDGVVIVPGHDSAVGRLYPSTDILGGGSLVRLG